MPAEGRGLYREAMFRWILRAGLIRFLGRRIIPVIAAYDAFRILRGARRRWLDPDA